MKPQVVALRKRTQIASANRTMFIWVAGVSVVFGFALVASMFLFQMLVFNERVLIKKNQTISNLKSNNSIADSLKKQVKALESNQALNEIKAYPDDNALQVILDALPSEANSVALGSSLQRKLIESVPGIIIESLVPEPVLGIEELNGDTAVVDASADGSSSQAEIPFSLMVNGTENNLKQMLINFEKSIRTIDVTMITIEKQSGADGQVSDILSLSLRGRAFYEPERTVQLKDEVVK